MINYFYHVLYCFLYCYEISSNVQKRKQNSSMFVKWFKTCLRVADDFSMDWHCTNTKKTSPLPPSLAAVASNSQVTGLRCGNCQELLTPPYIECDVCPSVLRIIDSKIKITPVFVCLQCFSRGATFVLIRIHTILLLLEIILKY